MTYRNIDAVEKGAVRIEYGKKLLGRRLQLHFTQAELAKRSGLGESTISAYERGERMPKTAHMMAIGEALELTLPGFGVAGLPETSNDDVYMVLIRSYYDRLLNQEQRCAVVRVFQKGVEAVEEDKKLL